MRFQWLGGPTSIIELGGFRVLTDPVLGTAFTLDTPAGPEQVTRLTPPPTGEPGALDLLLVTRNREDHIDRDGIARVATSTPALVSHTGAECVSGFGFDKVTPLAWLEAHTLDKGGERLTVLAAPTNSGSGDSNGYVLKHESDGKSYSVYISGDTLWFNDARDLKDRIGTPEFFVPYLGAVGANTSGGLRTLDAKEAMQFVFMFQPKRLVSVAHTTFSHYSEPIEAFKDRIDKTMYDRRLGWVKEGEIFEHNR